MSQTGIGLDIYEVVDELGMTTQILERDDSPIEEKVDYDSNSQMTKPFNAEHFLNVMFTYTTQVIPGDLIYAVSQDVYYRVMNTFPEVFEDKIIYKQGIVYKCNDTVNIYRPKEKRDSTGRIVVNWEQVSNDDVHALLTDKLYGSEINDENQFIQLELRQRVMYYPKKFEVLAKDRVITASTGKLYEVTYIETNTYPGMNVVYLKEDTRGSQVARDSDLV